MRFLFSRIASAFSGERIQNSNTNDYVSGAVHRQRRERPLQVYMVGAKTQIPFNLAVKRDCAVICL